MNLFYEEYPDYVTVDEKRYPILTDFREWIRLIDLVQDKDIPERIRSQIIPNWYREGVPPDCGKAITALADFLCMSSLEQADGAVGKVKNRAKLLSYSIDYRYILSGFQQCYGIDLDVVPHLHWWKFRQLLDGLDESTELKQRMLYRGIDLKDIKNKEERKRIQKIKKLVDLPQDVMEDWEIANAFV